MNQETWSRADAWLADALHAHDPVLEAALRANEEASLPSIDVSPMQGRFLALLARIHGARRILEIGTLGGYSSICLARALPSGGKLVTLELNPAHAAVARSNFDRAGLAGSIELVQGPALESLARLRHEGCDPFDLIFIDADKPGYPAYLPLALDLARPGAIIVGDNVIRKGEVANPASEDDNVLAVREFINLAAANPRLDCTVLQTVGKKGYDGILIARVLP